MSDELLRAYIKSLLVESPKSDAYENSVARSVNSFKAAGISATRPPADTSLPDVLVSVDGIGDAFIEVKMNHTDNLANPRVFYDGSKWATTYATPVAKYAVKLLNESDQAATFIRDLKKFLGRTPKQPLTLPTTKSGLLEASACPLKKMVKFATMRGDRYIVREEDVNIGRLATLHYTVGKSVPANYLQAADDFYLIGGDDPLGLAAVNDAPIPTLSGIGDFKVRVATRSEFYEIQAEVKIKKFNPSFSPYSVAKGSKKINPFTALADSLSGKKKKKR
jgi:hypothetical protein